MRRETESTRSAEPVTPCRDPEFLQRYLNEQLDEAEDARVQEHVSTCSACQSAMENAAGDAEIWASIRDELGVPEGLAGQEPDTSLAELTEYLAPTDDPAMLGRLGHHEVQAVIGSGSTGIVLKAIDPRLNRSVAIKLMSPDYRRSGAARRRFEREGRAVAAVAHDHVVAIHSVDEFRGLPYIVMQYVPGLSLQQRIDRDGPLDTRAVCRVAIQVASALAAAHAQGIVHRDVKPANVILEETVDRAIVTDFGLARVVDEVTMTHSGTITGTPQFMSPEQARGEVVDVRSDLFSLGSLLYAACTGHPPFRAQTLFGVIHRVCESEPRPIREMHPEIDAYVALLIETLMSKRVADRPQTADAVVAAFTAELAYLQNPVATPTPERSWLRTGVDAQDPVPEARGAARGALTLIGAGVLIACLVGWQGGWFGDWLPQGKGGNGNGGAAAAAWVAVGGPYTAEDEERWSRQDPREVGGTPRFRQSITKAIPMQDRKELSVRAAVGDVILASHEGTDVRVEIVREFAAKDRQAAGQLAARHEFRSGTEEGALALRSLCSDDAGLGDDVTLRVSMPQGTKLNVETEKGGVQADGLAGDVDLDVVDGDVELGRVAGSVEVQTLRGSISLVKGCSGKAELKAIRGGVRLAGVDGRATVYTSGGDIWLGACKGLIYSQTGGGSIYVEDVEGPTGAFAGDGDVIAKVRKTPTDNCRFNANNGNVRLLLGKDVAVKIAARGSVESDFTLAEEPSKDPAQGAWSVAVRNEGTVRIRACSDAGEVRIRELREPKGADEKTLGGSGKSLGGSGLGGSGKSLGGSGLGGSGKSLGGSSKGSGSSRSRATALTAEQRARTTGEPRPGAFVPVALTGTGRMDGYGLYLPPSHGKTEKAYPILVYLQGGFGVGGEISNVMHWGLARLVRDETDLSSERNQMLLDQFIIVCPHIEEGQFYDHPKVVRGILDTVITKYGGDPERIYLTGLSRGGHGSWGLAAKLPNTFAAIVPIGGNSRMVKDWKALTGTAIWVSHNRGDAIVSFQNAATAIASVERELDAKFQRYDKLVVAGTDYLDQRYILTSGLTDSHDAWTEIYARPEVYRWLLKQKRVPKKLK